MKCQHPFPVLVTAATMALALFLCVSGCKKEEAPAGQYTISGTVYYDCKRVPFAHQQLELVHYTNTTSFSYESPKATTDAFGHFSFSYSEAPGSSSFTDEYQIIVSSGSEKGRLLMSRIPGKQDAAVGDLYANNKIRIFVKVAAENSQSPEDTLFFGLSASDYHALCPIKSMEDEFEFNANVQLYSSMNQFNVNSFTYAVGYEAYSKSFQTAAAGKAQVLSNADCNSQRVVDTVRIVLP